MLMVMLIMPGVIVPFVIIGWFFFRINN
jgi:uncharacterized membrane protein YciS (DUF1049 family)